ncbi:response regulator transcription factor [Paenibacillus sp. WQ 127069]|uniref:Response regulator transcription factor n=1 Tax=Paenibacillus baimaensis TaxID=2982185 RepID=A0ABT2U8R5_9BACL|nr:response regulator transcription factor [Paenibacillus sp. WQ 127069]MCU6791029.1 response regulator transcription factor [Paenibacillus sp. WQ 127069]
MKILLAEDEQRLGKLTAHMLKIKGGHTVDWVISGETAYDYASVSSYDVLVLDWMLPDLDGWSVCQQLRLNGYTGAIMMLTARDSVQDRIKGLDAGADDYLIKPFEIEELLARIRALGRRSFTPLLEEVYRWGELELNRTSHIIAKGNNRVQLSHREFQLMDLLVQNKGQVLSRELILDRIWSLETEVTLKTIDATVKLLRRRLLQIDPGSDWIKNVWGVGYKIEA